MRQQEIIEKRQIFSIEESKIFNKSYNKTIQIQGNICPICEKEFASNFSVVTHLKNVHNPGKKYIKCDKCDFKTPRKGTMMLHITNRHSRVSLITCHTCGKKIKSFSYQKHLMRHTAPTEVINCEICGKELKSKQLKAHIKMVHSERKYACDQCNYRAPTDYNLRLHVSKIHHGKDLPKIQCELCEVITTNMSFHMKTYHPTDIIDKPYLLTLEFRKKLSPQAHNMKLCH